MRRHSRYRGTVVCTALFSLIACTPVDHQQTQESTPAGAFGALTATLLKTDLSSGLVVRHEMDRQEDKLRLKLQNTGVHIHRDGNTLRLIMPGHITFSSGRALINASFYRVLDSISSVLSEFQNTAVTVSGYTDASGAVNTNQVLSQKRAESVKTYFTGRGIAAGRIQAVGYGAQNPVSDNNTDQGRARNRRVEIALKPVI